ncbi:hypothetical protein SKAU_G00261060 [Synaphobranchus kaupii]|uniref:Uncharacterized protein n=1 Tax=Synaphobranchus kaupii TaxID=118154 RepID=A0A9Q1EYE5_SYNKA|nr:hypothetical protein SKAU_G00261060 [Synaphobranchus kaupii]
MLSKVSSVQGRGGSHRCHCLMTAIGCKQVQESAQLAALPHTEPLAAALGQLFPCRWNLPVAPRHAGLTDCAGVAAVGRAHHSAASIATVPAKASRPKLL